MKLYVVCSAEPTRLALCSVHSACGIFVPAPLCLCAGLDCAEETRCLSILGTRTYLFIQRAILCAHHQLCMPMEIARCYCCHRRMSE